MNLWGPLGKLQRTGASFYLRLADRFQENTVIRETWTAMSQDLDVQAASLKALHPTFWKQLEKQEKEILEAIAATPPVASNHGLDPAEWTLHRSFERTLDFEEHSSLTVYAPVIFYLRQQTGRALDFYVMVHAHLTRLARLIQPISGDPVLIQRCINLLEQFEKEAQGPKSAIVQPLRRAEKKVAAKGRRAAAARKPAQPAERSRTSGRKSAARKLPARHKIAAKRPHKHAKSIVKNLKLARRRARR